MTPAADVRSIVRGYCTVDGGEALALEPATTEEMEASGRLLGVAWANASATLTMAQGYGQDTFFLEIAEDGHAVASASTTAMIRYLGRPLHEYVEALLPADLGDIERLELLGPLGGFDAQSLSIGASLSTGGRADCHVSFFPAPPTP